VRVLLLASVLVGLGIVWCSGVLEPRSDEVSSPTLLPDGRPAFVIASRLDARVPPNAILADRLAVARQNLYTRLRKKNPAAWTFRAFPIQPYSAYALLSECRRVTGKRYLIAREVGHVAFGSTNILSGAQWVAAVEQALRDSGCLLLTNKTGEVKVIPKAKLDEYRKAGLVKSGDAVM
jgi:hypothetical protein